MRGIVKPVYVAGKFPLSLAILIYLTLKHFFYKFYASESLENLEEMSSWFYSHGVVCDMFKLSTTWHSVIQSEGFQEGRSEQCLLPQDKFINLIMISESFARLCLSRSIN